MRKLTILLAALMLCLQVFSGTVVYGETGDDDIVGDMVLPGENIWVEKYLPSDNNWDPPIREGESFGIHLFCWNTNGEHDLENVHVNVEGSSSFYGSPSSGKTLYEILEVGNDVGESEESLELVYKGTDPELHLTFTYDMNGQKYTESETLFIKEATPKSEEKPPVQTDTSQYKPMLITDNTGNMPVISAGSSYKLKYDVKNNSSNMAKNIKMTLKMIDETKAPLVLQNFDLRQAMNIINGNETEEVVFDIVINKTAPAGVYALKLDYDYYNSYGDNFTSSDTLYLKVVNNYVSPKLAVDSLSVRQSDTATNAIILDIKLKNLGDLKAEDIKVTLGGLQSGGYTAHNTTNVKYLNSLIGNATGTVSYELLSPTSGAAGSNELSVEFDYRDEAGNTYTEQNQIFVPAEGAGGSSPTIAFEKISAPQTAVEPNEDFSVSLDLKNNGGTAAKNIKVTLSTDQGIITKSMNPVYLAELDANTAKGISFKLFAADDAATKNYPIALNVEYEDALGNKFNATQYIGVFIENDVGKTVPRIIIDNYSMDPLPVNAGDDFKLLMSFLNTSKTVDVSNIKVTVTSDDGTFTPTDTGNTFYLESIPRTKNVEREMVLHVKPDAEQKSYMLTVDFEYEDDKGNPYTAKETMSVRVLQSPRLVTSELNLMPEAFVGQPVSVYMDFYNMGKSTLYNLMISVEGDFQGQQLSYYVGNFESGRTDFYDVSFTPMTPGMQKGSILFTFEDANGKETEVRKEFELNVMEMMMEGPVLDENGFPIDGGMGNPGMDGMPGMPGENGKPVSIWLYIGIGAGVIAIAIVLIIVLRKRHNRRKELSLDE